MSDVPNEILREILSMLPVASLLRFKCLSKSCKSLIEDHHFIQHHLNHSRKTDSGLSIILKSWYLHYADFDLLDQTNTATFKELSHPLETSYGRTEILGSCDGLLVLRNHEDGDTILWNLSIRRFHEIPYSCIGYPKEIPAYKLDTIYGFGYDVVSDDYKFIRIVQFYRKDNYEFNSEVKVYSLKSDSWRRIPDFPYYIDSSSTQIDGVLANGALHWIVRVKVLQVDGDNLVVAFDLGTEEYRLVPLPNIGNGDDISMNVAVLGGCLSLMCYDNDWEWTEHVDIWVMKKYGVQESWSFLFSFDSSNLSLMRPLAYSKFGKKVLLGILEDVELMWYDLDTKSTDLLPIVQMPLGDSCELYDVDTYSTLGDCCAAYTCLQSLVLLNNGICDFDLLAKKKQERKRRRRSLIPR